MLNTELVEYLLDIYTTAEVALFCEMEAYKNLLQNEEYIPQYLTKEDWLNIAETNYTKGWFLEKSKELRNKIKLEAQLPKNITF